MAGLRVNTVRVAQIVECTEAEGPGRRIALWFQGCPLRCPGCCNPEMLPFDGGDEMPIDVVAECMRHSRDEHGIEGISLVGGEPFAHASGAGELARAARELSLSVMVYSGYTLGELQTMSEPAVAELLTFIDVLVDGPYLRDQPEPRRRWVGSVNQRVHFLTNRYSPSDPCWSRTNTLEIRLRGGEISVNGFPSHSAVGLWRRPKLIEAS
jgi:anaerobic ribonucleoside-triphosphate reductase activating protein